MSTGSFLPGPRGRRVRQGNRIGALPICSAAFVTL